MRIRITKPTTIPLVDPGKEFYTAGAADDGHGGKIYFIHHAGNYIGIPEDMCELIPERNVCEAIRETEA